MKTLFILFFISLAGCNIDSSSIDKMQFNPELGFIPVENAISDIEYLFKRLEVVHYNPYLHITKEDISKKIKSLKGKWELRDSLMNSEFIIETMKLLSEIEDGHTKMVWYSTEIIPKRDSINYFPFQLKFDKEKGVYISDTSSLEYQNEKILLINGLNAQKLYSEALECLSGNFEYKNELTSSLFFPIFLYLKGISAPFAIELESEKIIIDSFQTISFLELYKRLQPSKLNYEFTTIEHDNIGLLSYNSCTDYDAFKIFLDTTFQQIKQDRVKDLMIDIRYNSGGNSALNDLLLAYITNKQYRQSSKRLWKLSNVSIDELNGRGIRNEYGKDYIERYRLKNDTTILVLGEDVSPKAPKKVDNYFEGDCYLLIGPKTYSSANMLADAVYTYKLFSIIGMPTGERTNDFGEQKTEYLPHSNFPFDFTIAYDIGANGDKTVIQTVEPDIKVEGDALEYTINLILRKRKNTDINLIQLTN